MNWFGRLLMGSKTEPTNRAEPVGSSDLLNLLEIAACKDCGTVFYLEYTDECPNCGSDNFKSQSPNPAEGGL